MKYYKPTQHSIFHSAYCMLYAILFVIGGHVWNAFDWFGRKLVDLVDHSDFFAGCVWTYVVMTAWEMLTR